MTLYIARRLVWTLVVVACVVAITFAVFYLLPAGDPALRFAGKNPTDAEIAQIHHRLGLDKPWYVQFGRFSWHFFAGDKYGWPGLGYTYASGSSVKSLIVARAPRTLLLIAGAAMLWLIAGVAIGVLSAVKRRSAVDRLAMGFALFGISTPVFWLGLMALYIFWRQLGWTGGSGYVSPLTSVTGFFSHMILPWGVLALLYAAFYARMTRNNLLETLGEDYIRTARA
jgi:peptide/nickel transport system permease protein